MKKLLIVLLCVAFPIICVAQEPPVIDSHQVGKQLNYVGITATTKGSMGREANPMYVCGTITATTGGSPINVSITGGIANVSITGKAETVITNGAGLGANVRTFGSENVLSTGLWGSGGIPISNVGANLNVALNVGSAPLTQASNKLNVNLSDKNANGIGSIVDSLNVAIHGTSAESISASNGNLHVASPLGLTISASVPLNVSLTGKSEVMLVDNAGNSVGVREGALTTNITHIADAPITRSWATGHMPVILRAFGGSTDVNCSGAGGGATLLTIPRHASGNDLFGLPTISGNYTRGVQMVDYDGNSQGSQSNPIYAGLSALPDFMFYGRKPYTQIVDSQQITISALAGNYLYVESVVITDTRPTEINFADESGDVISPQVNLRFDGDKPVGAYTTTVNEKIYINGNGTINGKPAVVKYYYIPSAYFVH